MVNYRITGIWRISDRAKELMEAIGEGLQVVERQTEYQKDANQSHEQDVLAHSRTALVFDQACHEGLDRVHSCLLDRIAISLFAPYGTLCPGSFIWKNTPMKEHRILAAREFPLY